MRPAGLRDTSRCRARTTLRFNISERHLRRQAVGRENWLFIGSEDGAAVNTTFSTLIASCHMHDIESEGYLREVMCLLPDWSRNRVLELAPSPATGSRPDSSPRLSSSWLPTCGFHIGREIDAIHARSHNVGPRNGARKNVPPRTLTAVALVGERRARKRVSEIRLRYICNRDSSKLRHGSTAEPDVTNSAANAARLGRIRKCSSKYRERLE
jgi:hypothetical protein